jgi:hypothetical protein
MKPPRSRKSKPTLFILLGIGLFGVVFAVVQYLTDPDRDGLERVHARTPPRPATPAATARNDEAINAAAEPSAGDGPCRIAITGDSPVRRACLEGVTAHAKKEMTRLVVAAKAQGVMFACDSCHEGGNADHDLVGEAREKFQTLLVAAGQTPAPAAPVPAAGIGSAVAE